MINHSRPVLILFLVFVGVSASWACSPGQSDEKRVHSHLEGQLKVRAEVDSTRDYSGFEALVIDNTSGDVDTLGIALTDSTGHFSMDVSAPFKGVFPLMVSREGAVLAFDEFVVAEGDSSFVSGSFPLGNRRLVVRRSVENGAWMAYRNVRDQHNRVLADLVRPGAYDENLIRRAIQQTSNVFWSLRETYPNTLGASIASGESVVMLDGWNDSLLVERVKVLPLDQPNLVDIVRAARRAEARLHGQEAAIRLVRSFQSLFPDGEDWAALQSEIVIARIDSLERGLARDAARELSGRAPNSQWVRWSERVLYELDNLMPGMRAPGFLATDMAGQGISLDSLRGRVVLLEYFSPTNKLYLQELGLRNKLFDALQGFPFVPIDISLEPDTVINEAYYEGRAIPGRHVIAPEGLDGPLAQLYNVNVIPTRYLVDQDGRIVRKYVGSAMIPLQQDLARLLNLRLKATVAK